MNEIIINGKKLLMSNEEIDDIIKKHPKQVFVVSPEGKTYEYTVPFKKHHCEVYGQIIKDINSDLNLEWTNKLMSNYDEYEKSINRYDNTLKEIKSFANPKVKQVYETKKSGLTTKIASVIRDTLIKHDYFICQTLVNTKDLNHYCIFLSEFKNKNTIQKEKILDLFFNLNLNSYDKVESENDNMFKKSVFEVKSNRISK